MNNPDNFDEQNTEYDDLALVEIEESPTDFELIKELIHKIGTEISTESMTSVLELKVLVDRLKEKNG